MAPSRNNWGRKPGRNKNKSPSNNNNTTLDTLTPEQLVRKAQCEREEEEQRKARREERKLQAEDCKDKKERKKFLEKSNMPPYKEEHVMLLSPGSKETLAQLGLPESFTPAKYRFPSYMFRAAAGGWEPYKVRQKVVKVKKPKTTTTATTHAPDPAEAANGDAKTQDGVDTEMKDATEGDQTANNEASAEEEEYEEQTILEEDTTSDEGAVYAMHQGKIVNWGCFFALLTHIYNTLSPPFHTPILLISQPAWTSRDREIVTQFIFEKFKVPAFSMMDSAAAVAYGYGAQTATIIDIGYEKADVTAIVDHLTSDDGRGIALEGCGGEAMTQRLHQILGPKGFTRDMCEQLKKSNICEILPAGTPLPVASGAAGAPLPKPVAAPPPGRGPEMPRTAVNGDPEEDDGVLDVAAIVSGNPSEYLAKKEREKAERAAARKNAAAEAGAAKPVRLPNAKKEKATFQCTELVKLESEDATQSGTAQYIRQRREIEVGVERFMAATPSEKAFGFGILEKLAAQIHHTIHSVPASRRAELWDSLIIIGNGSKIKGFPQALLATIQQKYVLSPSSGTIFTSEIPSALSTPLPTGGTNTPASFQNPGPLNHPAAHGVNPLLVAATHANAPAGLQNNAGGGGDQGGHHNRSTGHSQTPTSIKQLKPPNYFPEWKSKDNADDAAGDTTTGTGGTTSSNAAKLTGTDGNTSRGGGGANVGMEEAVFLGAQVAAKVFFIVDQGLNKGFLPRVVYNEQGPTAIHEYAL